MASTMAARMTRGILVAGIVGLLLPAIAQACSSFVIQEKGRTVSARTLDFPALGDAGLIWVPKGLKAQVTPVLNTTYSSLGSSYTVKYNYLSMVIARDVYMLLYKSLCAKFPGLQNLDPKYWSGAAYDGMNEKGLTAAILWQTSTPYWPAYNVAKGGIAVEQADGVSYMLANFDSVASIKAAVKKNEFTTVANPLFSYGTQLAFGSSFLPCHYIVYDAYGAGLVIEVTENGFQFFDNPIGVATNNPLFPQQLEYYYAWLNKVTQPPYNYTTPHDTTFYPPPGSFNSSDRFTRLAMLKNAASTNQWGTNAITSPSSPLALPTGGRNGPLMTAMNIIQTVYLPLGVEDAGGYWPPMGNGQYNKIDWTIWTSLRDQSDLVYYR